jgi:serine/threonine protein kinase
MCPICGKTFSQSLSHCPFDSVELVRQLPDPLIGTMLPRQFRITGKLGKGAMSVVYAGVYEPLGQPVAIKLLKSHLVSDQVTFKRFQQEAKTAGALEHPNIVGVLDFGVTDQGVPYLIMELLRGDSLKEHLHRKPPPDLLEIIQIFMQAADALYYTHQRGIIHRDVKPSNILIVNENGKDVVKIVDFGIAKMQTLDGNALNADLTATGEVFGTPLYVSPEQAMGRTLDSRADIYSLGCVLYEAVAGKPAFNAPSAFDVIRMQITQEHIPLDAARPDLQLPPSLLAAVDRAMTKDPNERYQTMAELVADLRNACNEYRNGVFGRAPRSSSNLPIISSSRNPIAQSSRVHLSSSNMPVLSPDAVPPKKRLPIMLFLAVWISGCLTGVLVLFCLDFKEKLELATSPTEQMVVSSNETAPESSPEILDPKAVALSKSAADNYDVRKYGAAEADCLAALKIAESKKQDVGAAVLRTQIASVYLATEKFKAAQQVLAKAIPVLETATDQKDNLGNALNLQGIAYYYMRDPNKAEPLLERAYKIDSELYGTQSSACAGVQTNLARVYEMNHKLDLAERLYRDSMEVSQKIYPPGDKKLIARMNNLASFLKRRNKTVEAASLERQAKEMAAKQQ